jgi:uncharacterized protein
VSGSVVVGHVREVLRYPVKSMGPVRGEQAAVGWRGLDGDRRWAFVRDDAPTTFPWLTIRQLPEIAAWATSYADPAHPERGPVLVTVPGAPARPVTHPSIAAELSARYGGPVRAVGNQRGQFDAMPIALITAQTIERMATHAGHELDVLRFRPNIVIDAVGERAFAEDAWVGRSVSFGDDPGAARVRIDLRDKRCAVVNVDPYSADRDPAVLRAIARHNDATLGVYGTVERPGAVRVGDPVLLCPG